MQNSNHFANEIPEGWKAVVDRYLPDFAINAKTDPCGICTRDPRRRDRAEVEKHTPPVRCLECTRKRDKVHPCQLCTRDPARRDPLAPGRARGCLSCPVGLVRTWRPSPCATCAFWKNKKCTTTKSHCPSRLTICSRSDRKKAAWKLRGIDGRKGRHHWMFVRRKTNPADKTDPGVVQPALKERLQTIQTSFESYHEDVSKRVIILRKKTDGSGFMRRSQKQPWSERRDMVSHLLKDGDELVLDFQTRFTDEGRQKEEVKKFHDTWRTAAKNYDSAVFLTLTSDPDSGDSLWDVDRAFTPNWNTYLSTLTKRLHNTRRDDLIKIRLDEIKKEDPARWEAVNRDREADRKKADLGISLLRGNCQTCRRGLGYRHPDTTRQQRQDYRQAVFGVKRKIKPWLGLSKGEIWNIRTKLETRTLESGEVVKESFRPVYLAVYEFMENGLLHSHITIFGTTWIDRIEQISEDWDGIGQGSIVHAYAMTKNPADGTWEWLGKPPKDSRNRQPVDYLIKYLIKGLYTREGHGMYWALNKRFFTRSQSLGEGWVDFGSREESVWELLASLHEDRIPMSLKIQQRGSPLLKDWYERVADSGGGGALA